METRHSTTLLFILMWIIFPNKNIHSQIFSQQHQSTKGILANLSSINTTPGESTYPELIQNIRSERISLKQKLERGEIRLQEVGHNFEKIMVEQIFPYWYGTDWDFNGFTNIPGKGNIACGYFVSTTLKHCGLSMNRYHLAQQSPINEALSLDLEGDMKVIDERSSAEAIQRLNYMTSEGLYFIGLDESHVGFLLKRNSHLFFIHSNYLGEAKVTVELAEASPALNSFSTFYLVPISSSKSMMEAWLNQTEIKVIKT